MDPFRLLYLLLSTSILFFSSFSLARPADAPYFAIDLDEPAVIPGQRYKISSNPDARDSDWYEPWTTHIPENEFSGLYRSENKIHGISNEIFAWDSGLEANSIQSLIRNLSDWPTDEVLSTKEQMHDMHRVCRKDPDKKTQKTTPAYSRGIDHKDIEMTLNGIRGPSLQFPVSVSNQTAVSGNSTIFPTTLTDYEIRFTIPREILLLSINESLDRLIDHLENDLHSYNVQYEEQLWKNYAKINGLKKNERYEIDQIELEALLIHLSTKEGE